jgi:hypothetical protein
MRSTNGLERREQRVMVGADRGENTAAFRSLGVRQREEKMFGGDVLVAECLGFVLGFVEDLVQLT